MTEGILHLELTHDRSKKVAKLLSNETARKIMDSVSEDSKSESQLANELKMPLTTVHYNIKQLKKAGLIVSDEYNYSKKGKEIRYYRLASEHVIITTKKESPIPALFTGAGVVVAIGIIYAFISSMSLQASSLNKMADTAYSAPVAEESARLAADAAMQSVASQPVVWPWFIVAALIIITAACLHWFTRRNA